MKILLTTINSKYIHQNLAIRLLYELNKNYKSLSWKEFGLKNDNTEIVDYCSDFQIICFSCYIWNITRTLEVAELLKQINPNCKILLGGPEVSFDYEEIINLNYVDFIIKNDGEIPFSEFLKSYPNFEKISNLIWKKDNQIVDNHDCKLFDLSDLRNVNPYKNEPVEELKHKISYIETSRGCPHTCSFCLAGLDNKLRYLPKKFIEKNLLFLMENGKTIKFLDRTFNANLKFTLKIFDFILKNYKPDNIFQFEIKADKLQPDLIDYIKTKVPKGIFRFEIGIQTLNSQTNNAIKRKQNFENIKTLINEISDKIEIHLDLIVGLPFDYYEDIKFSFEEIFKLFAPELQLGFLKFLKGTPIRKNHKLHDYKFSPNPPYQVISSKYLSKNEIEDLLILEDVLDIYWNKKRTINTLKYITLNYSIFDFLLDFGKYFSRKEKNFKVNLINIYTAIYQFSNSRFESDKILNQLITIDYYLQHKVKPKERFEKEIDKKRRNQIIKNQKLNHHKYRFSILEIDFDWEFFSTSMKIEKQKQIIVIQFDGINFPTLFQIKK